MVAKHTAGSRAYSLLRPKYTCLTCSEAFAPSGRKKHTEKTGHSFCKLILCMTLRTFTDPPLVMESRNRALYCQSCEDLIYDHGLERLRSSSSEHTLLSSYTTSNLCTFQAKVNQLPKNVVLARARPMSFTSEAMPADMFVRKQASGGCITWAKLVT